MSWPEQVMVFYSWGFVAGIERGREQAEAEMVRGWRFVFEAVQRQAKTSPHADLEERRRRHQLEAWQRNQAAARPWPPETAPLNPHALFGQPQRQRVNT
jgi:hypothetical protein